MPELPSYDDVYIHWDYALPGVVAFETFSVNRYRKELTRLYRELGEVLGLDIPPPF